MKVSKLRFTAKGKTNLRGNCYVACEALYHLLGGKESGYKPMWVKHCGDTHWFLKHSSGLILDPTRLQFHDNLPHYDRARACGFLTKSPSFKAKELMYAILWQWT